MALIQLLPIAEWRPPRRTCRAGYVVGEAVHDPEQTLYKVLASQSAKRTFQPVRRLSASTQADLLLTLEPEAIDLP